MLRMVEEKNRLREKGVIMKDQRIVFYAEPMYISAVRSAMGSYPLYQKCMEMILTVKEDMYSLSRKQPGCLKVSQ